MKIGSPKEGRHDLTNKANETIVLSASGKGNEPYQGVQIWIRELHPQWLNDHKMPARSASGHVGLHAYSEVISAVVEEHPRLASVYRSPSSLNILEPHSSPPEAESCGVLASRFTLGGESGFAGKSDGNTKRSSGYAPKPFAPQKNYQQPEKITLHYNLSASVKGKLLQSAAPRTIEREKGPTESRLRGRSQPLPTEVIPRTPYTSTTADSHNGNVAAPTVSSSKKHEATSCSHTASPLPPTLGKDARSPQESQSTTVNEPIVTSKKSPFAKFMAFTKSLSAENSIPTSDQTPHSRPPALIPGNLQVGLRTQPAINTAYQLPLPLRQSKVAHVNPAQPNPGSQPKNRPYPEIFPVTKLQSNTQQYGPPKRNRPPSQLDPLCQQPLITQRNPHRQPQSQQRSPIHRQSLLDTQRNLKHQFLTKYQKASIFPSVSTTRGSLHLKHPASESHSLPLRKPCPNGQPPAQDKDLSRQRFPPRLSIPPRSQRLPEHRPSAVTKHGEDNVTRSASTASKQPPKPLQDKSAYHQVEDRHRSQQESTYYAQPRRPIRQQRKQCDTNGLTKTPMPSLTNKNSGGRKKEFKNSKIPENKSSVARQALPRNNINHIAKACDLLKEAGDPFRGLSNTKACQREQQQSRLPSNMNFPVLRAGEPWSTGETSVAIVQHTNMHFQRENQQHHQLFPISEAAPPVTHSSMIPCADELLQNSFAMLSDYSVPADNGSHAYFTDDLNKPDGLERSYSVEYGYNHVGEDDHGEQDSDEEESGDEERDDSDEGSSSDDEDSSSDESDSEDEASDEEESTYEDSNYHEAQNHFDDAPPYHQYYQQPEHLGQDEVYGSDDGEEEQNGDGSYWPEPQQDDNDGSESNLSESDAEDNAMSEDEPEDKMDYEQEDELEDDEGGYSSNDY